VVPVFLNIYSLLSTISSNDLDQLVDGVVNVCNNNKLYKSIGVNARNEILNKFSMESFMNNWNDIFDKAYNKRLGELNEIFYNK
jgi:glycosyltransferase involved in cell wall biosynthesis